MPYANNEFKDGLRIQRDYLDEIVAYIDNGEPEKAKEKAKKVLKRINESLQD